MFAATAPSRLNPLLSLVGRARCTAAGSFSGFPVPSMPFQQHQQHQQPAAPRLIHVASAPNHPSETEGVVIMYGWLGSKPSQVEKYAKLYQDRGCTVVYDIAPFKDAVLRNEESLSAVATRTAIKAAEIIKEIETEKTKMSATKSQGRLQEGDGRSSSEENKVPVLLHYFSNGGAFVAERLACLIDEAKLQDSVVEENTTTSISNEEEEDITKSSLMMISDRLYERGYEVADSAPADIHKNLQRNVIESAIPNQLLQVSINAIAQIRQSFLNAFMISQEQVRAIFWNNMTQSDLCVRQAFIYSANDRIADPNMIDQLVEARRNRGIDVISARFEESEHVSHFRQYPEEYSELIDRVTKTVFQQEQSNQKSTASSSS